jgi:hypothetical protein
LKISKQKLKNPSRKRYFTTFTYKVFTGKAGAPCITKVNTDLSFNSGTGNPYLPIISLNRYANFGVNVLSINPSCIAGARNHHTGKMKIISVASLISC